VIRVAVRVVSNNLDRYGAAARAGVRRERLAAGLRVEGDWKGDVRVDTGNYRRSIHTEDGADETVVSSNVEYAGFNEYGTSRMAARPSATKAAEKNRRPYQDAVAKVLRGP
jgi:phage gpG-like protein